MDFELITRLNDHFVVLQINNTLEARAVLGNSNVDALISTFDPNNPPNFELISTVRKSSPRIFIAFFSAHAVQSAGPQTMCNNAGANMVSDNASELLNTFIRALKVIGRDPFTVGPTYACPVCNFDGLQEDELCDHVILYHGGQSIGCDVNCPVCNLCCKGAKIPFPVHIHKCHGVVGRSRQTVPRKQHHTYIFVLVVCQRESDGKFLLVNEPAAWGWWLPGGRVEWGEGLRNAAQRETLEEAGIEIDIKGILKFEYSSGPSRTRQRIIFFARPVNEFAKPKCIPDYSSRGACWVSVDELERIPLRADEPKTWANHIIGGGTIHSMDLLSQEREESSKSDRYY
jgi:ADP-ribose pyrophosphatase YjhB (NUDIX family)